MQFGSGVGKGSHVRVLVRYSVLTCVVETTSVVGPQYKTVAIGPMEELQELVQVYTFVENVVLSYSEVVVKVS